MGCDYSIIFKDSDETAIRKIMRNLLDAGVPEEKMQVCPPERNAEPVYIIGWYRHNLLRLCSEEIMYITNVKHGSAINVRSGAVRNDFDKCLVSHMKLKELYSELKKHDFVLAHNSYIVNMNYIRYCTKKEIELTDGTLLTIARSKERVFRESFEDYLERKRNIIA